MEPLKGVTPELAHRWLDVVVQSMIISGHLTKEEANNPLLIMEKMESLFHGANLLLVIDHRERILQMAESHHVEGHEEWSALFYALYFEHTINNIIDAILCRQKKNASVSKGLIRACKMNDKLGWVLDLLDLQAFDEKHRKVIERVCEERNAFAHYKWTATDFNKSLADLLKSANDSVGYLKEYEARALYP